MTYADTITFGGHTFSVTSITPTRRQKTIKQQIGKTIAEIKVAGLNEQQWELNIKGVMVGPDIDSERSNLESLDDAAPHAFADGMHNGTYIMVPGSLQFEDSGDTVHTHYNFSFNLIEE